LLLFEDVVFLLGLFFLLLALLGLLEIGNEWNIHIVNIVDVESSEVRVRL
jgi:hypothetical protein